jgi:cathepsin L
MAKYLVGGVTAAGLAAAGYMYRDNIESEIITIEDYKFMEHVTTYGKSYATKAEFALRSKIFKEKLSFIEEWNNNTENTHKVGTNAFSDYTVEEMNKMKGYKATLKKNSKLAAVEIDPATVGDAIDWREKGAVNPVQNQSMCGSCWAFSATAALEGAYFVKNGDLKKFSEQQLVDCSSSYGNMGCSGGLMDSAFEYVEKYGQELEADYGYKAVDGSCAYSSTKTVGTASNFNDVTPGSADALKLELQSGPVSVAIEADRSVFQSFTSGVITSAACGQQLDHGVVAVGWGTDPSAGDYFIVRNSWGASWGLSGYVNIGAGSSNVCGILTDASRPIA